MIKKKNEKLPFLYFKNNGILTVSYKGKVFLIFVSGVLSLWVLMLLLINWEILKRRELGKVIFYLSAISGGLLVLTVFQKFYFKNFTVNISRQLSVLLYFITIFIAMFGYSALDFPNTEVYENPIQMIYIFIIFYLAGYYLLFNFSD